jgi:hypothetical protein
MGGNVGQPLREAKVALEAVQANVVGVILPYWRVFPGEKMRTLGAMPRLSILTRRFI